MKFRTVLYPEAESELKALAFHLDETRNGSGDELIFEYFRTLDYLQDFAEARPVCRKKFRKVLIGKFPVYMIYELRDSEVQIKRIIHAARKEDARFRNLNR